MSDEEFQQRLDEHFRFRGRTFWMTGGFFFAFGVGVCALVAFLWPSLARFFS